MAEAKPSENFSRAVIHGAAWRYLAFFSGKLILFVSTAVLARLLSKDDFGVVGFALTTMAFFDVISDMGVGPALIYYAEEKDTSATAFWLNLGISVALFGIAWLLAPFIALFFHDERAVGVVRVMSLSYPLSAIGSVHQYLLQKKLAFGKTFAPEFIRSVAKGGSSILFALFGYGAWSLIFGQLTGELASSLAYWYLSPWRLHFGFSVEKARNLLHYGYRYTGADTIAIILQNLDYLLVGRYLGAEALGVYTLAFRLPDLVILQFARTLSAVVFPVYSRMRETSSNLAEGFFMTTRYVSLITVPLGLGMALVARPFTLAVFSDKWIEAVPALQGIAIYAMLLSLAYNAGGAYKATGRPQIIMWLGLARLAFLFPVLWWAVNSAHSIVAVSWGHALVAFISALMSLYVAARILNLPQKRLAQALFPSLLCGAIMSVVVALVLRGAQNASSLIQLLLSVLAGGAAYGLSLWVFQRDAVEEGVRKLRQAVKK